MPPSPFKLRHRILTRYGESDMQAVIFNARYLDYADLAISVYWKRLGMDLFGDTMLSFHVANANIDFKKPIQPFELIDLCCVTERIGTTSLTTLIELRGAAEEGEGDLRAAIRIVHVSVDMETHRPRAIADEVKQLLHDFDNRIDVLLTGERD